MVAPRTLGAHPCESWQASRTVPAPLPGTRGTAGCSPARGTPILPGVDIREWIGRQQAAHARLDREEMARLRAMSVHERVELLGALCRSAMELVHAMPPEVRSRALAHRDPLPESTRVALARLRRTAKGPR